MRKSDKKIDNQIRSVLTDMCENTCTSLSTLLKSCCSDPIFCCCIFLFNTTCIFIEVKSISQLSLTANFTLFLASKCYYPGMTKTGQFTVKQTCISLSVLLETFLFYFPVSCQKHFWWNSIFKWAGSGCQFYIIFGL